MNPEHWYKYQEYIYKVIAKMAGTLSYNNRSLKAEMMCQSSEWLAI
ncbi:hypothetical protein [Dyadobacter sp. 3J3]|nr:hypothetical protein [Dyadobacter sp. 3J3]